MWEIGLYSAVAPFGLLLLSVVWKYPAVLEEVVKWGILRMGISNREHRIVNGVVVGLAFGLSEAILFTTNAWMSGDWQTIAVRLLLTVPMHTFTAWIIAVAMKHQIGYVGVLIAMLVHGGFNYLVGLIA